MGGNRKKLLHFLRVDPAAVASALSSPRSISSSSSSFSDDDGYSSSSFQGSASSSPSRYNTSPPKSPWARLPGLGGAEDATSDGATGLIASLVKEDGKVYSLAAAGDVLYTGTDSENVRVWRDRRELAGFRTGSGLVKAIVVAADGRIFTGHQDGKVRVWRRAGDDDGEGPAVHRRVGSLPPLGDLLVSSVNPSSYVRSPRGSRRRRAVVWLRHSDAVSSLSLDEAAGLLYSASWDRTFKAWRVSDYRCLESVPAHDDAVNTVAAAGFGGLVLTGSADGTVKVWRREVPAVGDRTTRHVLERVLREGDGAVTAIASCPEARAVYVGSSDGLVMCWRWRQDVDGGELRLAAVLAGHGMAGVLCLAVSGRVVVSGSADGTLCVWRRDDDDVRERAGGHGHALLTVLTGHTGPVKCVAVAADDDDDCCYDADDGERRFVVYSGSLDGSVKVWRLSEERALEPPAAAVETATAPFMAAVETTTAPFMAAALRESEPEPWTMPRPRTTQLPSPVQVWPPEMKGVAAA